MSALGDSLRELADRVDSNEYLAEIFAETQFGTCLFGEEAELFDAFLAEFGGEYRVTPNVKDDVTYVVSEATVGSLTVWCQTREPDYSVASGKTHVSGKDGTT